MTGSLQIKNNKYYMVINTYENGKRKPIWISTKLEVKGNKRIAEQMLRDELTRRENPQYITANMLFSEAVKKWLDNVNYRVDQVTYEGYENLATKHIMPYFASVKLNEITVQVLQKYFDEKARNGRLDGKGGLSPKTLRMHKNIISQVLDDAVRNELIPNNPCQYVKLPAKQKFASSYYNKEQIKVLTEAAKEDVLYPLIKITVIYGLRRSEVLGIKWDSIDFVKNTLTIKHTVSKVKTVVEKDKTKNESSHRVFPLTEETRAIFEQLRKEETENKSAFKSEYNRNEYVFKWPDGTTFRPDFVSRHFSILLKKHNLPKIRFHELRHSCASLLINNGCLLKDVQAWLGHSDIRMTADLYGHLDMSRKNDTANLISTTLK